MKLSFRSYGAAREVTGSKHLVTCGKRQYLLDCGMFQGHRAESDVKNRTLPFSVADLAAVVLTHGHFDHSGNMPTLTKHGYRGNIYATPATRDIANLILLDAAHIMAKDYEWMLKKERGKKAYPPLYTANDVVTALEHFVTIGLHRRFPLDDGVTCEFSNSGHILGSAVAALSFGGNGEPLTLGFTGDIGRPGMPIIRDPEPIPPVDYLICEGTYGNRRHDPIEDAQQQMAAVIRETAHKGGKIIIPAFAVGRTQELIYDLHLLKDARAIPDLDIFVDSPMAINATGIFQVHQECYDDETRQAFLDHHQNPFGFTNLHYVQDVEESKRLNDRPDPCIIISSSGMCEAGRILHHLKNNIANPRNTILIVGFMAANTLGRALADRQPVVKIFGDPYPLRARVKILNTFSGHADFEDLRSYISRMDRERLRKIFLVHGENDALENLRTIFLDAGVKAVAIVEPEQDYLLE